MYIIKITDESCKVILSKDDLSKYGDDVFFGGKTSEKFFEDILSLFPHSHRQSSVAHADFFEDKFGGGELFILFSKNKSLQNSQTFIFSSDSINGVIDVCCAISRIPSKEESSLILYKNKYRLIIKTTKNVPYLKELLKEYGDCIVGDNLDLWIMEEHGKTIIENNATEKITEVFNKI